MGQVNSLTELRCKENEKSLLASAASQTNKRFSGWNCANDEYLTQCEIVEVFTSFLQHCDRDLLRKWSDLKPTANDEIDFRTIFEHVKSGFYEHMGEFVDHMQQVSVTARKRAKAEAHDALALDEHYDLVDLFHTEFLKAMKSSNGIYLLPDYGALNYAQRLRMRCRIKKLRDENGMPIEFRPEVSTTGRKRSSRRAMNMR